MPCCLAERTQRMYRYYFLPLLLITLIAFAPGCGSGPAGEVTKLTGAGASFPYPLYSKWFKDYKGKHPNVLIDYQSIGSGKGVKAFIDGTVDFGASDAAIDPGEVKEVEEKQKKGTVVLPMTAGTIVLAYNLEGVK